MERLIEPSGVHARILSPADGHYFFAYYDLQPFDSTGRYHLCHKAPFEDHIPGETDVCEIGLLDTQTRQFRKLGETTAWNFQQGAMLQWYRDDRHIFYNIRENGKLCSCIQNIETGEKRILPMAAANLSADGSKALCINFSRIFDFRPGYGYAGVPDPFAQENAPENDGIFVMDTETGACRMVVSYAQLRDAFPEEAGMQRKLLVNHITYNPSGTRFVFLLRTFPTSGFDWKTMLLTCDDHGALHAMTGFSNHSHYHWKNDDELLIVSRLEPEDSDWQLYLFRDSTGQAQRLPQPDPAHPLHDIHCLHSPNRRYIMGDGYPIEGYRTLHFIDTETNRDSVLGRYYSFRSSVADTEYRCDLHARFDRSGRYVSLDSNHIGNRCVCLLDLAELPGYEF